MDLKNTIDLMLSENYKERFKAEYWQTKERYERLKHFCNKIEANDYDNTDSYIPPVHDCDFDLLKKQQRAMVEYLHILELRAIIEKIDLKGE